MIDINIARRFRQLQNARADFRPMSFLQPVNIGDNYLSGEDLTYNGVKYYRPESMAKWNVTYESTTRAPLRIQHTEKIEDRSQEAKQLIDPQSELDASIKYDVQPPEVVDCSASVSLGPKQLDSINKKFDVGGLIYELLPEDEFPIMDGVYVYHGENYRRRGRDQDTGSLMEVVENEWKTSGLVETPEFYYKKPGASVNISHTTKIKNISGEFGVVGIGPLYAFVAYKGMNKYTAKQIDSNTRHVELGPGATYTVRRSGTLPSKMTGFVQAENVINIKTGYDPNNPLEPPTGFEHFKDVDTFKIGKMVPP